MIANVRFTDGNLETSKTPVRAEWLNHIQEELCTPIELQGIELEKTNHEQLSQSLRQLASGPILYHKESIPKLLSHSSQVIQVFGQPVPFYPLQDVKVKLPVQRFDFLYVIERNSDTGNYFTVGRFGAQFSPKKAIWCDSCEFSLTVRRYVEFMSSSDLSQSCAVFCNDEGQIGLVGKDMQGDHYTGMISIYDFIKIKGEIDQ